ncbi:MAG: endonuclease [Candidatus Stygibacter australis]|nr:endonuclease [Candidatus Stygibacter australis]
MKRYIVTLVLLSSLAVLFAEVIAPGLVEEGLWDYLVDNYKTTTTLGYDDARDVLYGEIDSQPDNQLSCIYTNFTITLDPDLDPSTNAFNQGINCEHTWPQSYGADQEPQRSDMHHLYPCKDNVNSSRSNAPYAEIPDNETDIWYRYAEVLTTIPTSNIDEYSEKDNYGEDQWEPREASKGNIARSMFYFYTMYYDDIDDTFINDQMNDLYSWHLEDPADDDEIARTWAISAYQENKPNPFVIDDTLIERIWYYQGGQAEITLIAPNGSEIWFIGNQYEISWSSLAYYESVTLEIVLAGQELTIAEDEANDGSYLWTISENIPVGEQYRIRVGTPDGTVTDESDADFSIMNQNSGEDFVLISEYVEGSYYHKALEIFNGSPEILDLAGWTLRKQTNGGGDFGNELVLSGTVAPWDVYVIIYENNGINDLTGEDFVDMETSSFSMTFNGNDAVALFNNGVMVDLVGIPDSSEDWGKDMTLVRNSNIAYASTAFDTTAWTQYPEDTFSYLGYHDFEQPINYGDVDGNGEVEAYDASLVLQYIVVLISGWDIEQITVANVDGNEIIDAYDASLILRYVNNVINIFPVQQ